jgi:hypothetical protein
MTPPLPLHAETDPQSHLDDVLHEPRLWRDNGWTAKVIKNEDDDGWAVSMYLAGQSEPALVGPWTMGRNKKDPKPLDTGAFNTLVKTASEVIRRHEQQLRAQLHKEIHVDTAEQRILVSLDIVPDEDHPYALLTAVDSSTDETLAQLRVSPTFKLTRTSAEAWVASGFASVGRARDDWTTTHCTRAVTSVCQSTDLSAPEHAPLVC